ncbi:MAG: dihydroneopterin aldolase [candidate division WOR-3 bacterium]|nr:dihydroneopterin aldolase [candidate division WOR-3 bacterium]
MKSIGLSGVVVEKVCGFGREREKPQKLEIDVKIETDFSKVASYDGPSYGIDLKTVYDLITLSLKDEVYTIEAIAYRIWKQLKNLKSAEKVMVKVQKSKPPFDGKVRYSWAIIEE